MHPLLWLALVLSREGCQTAQPAKPGSQPTRSPVSLMCCLNSVVPVVSSGCGSATAGPSKL
ncbi:hypothetical protein OUZ56_031269 [Daphnia magna]|uniref:Uncharacterized protein n=1 Tax=Daphnia magna TaxID=35525 RepID=A0ABQ9ZTS0_9CRUS|nr:hypothetical protein OUZ56_031269 [Daphnia magna]